ncbi:MAG TPA: carboxypeptidase regulatory-like domain-containing protein [Longimicrobiaceae bacterium]|nr:carboxypeptidase regulatory-like domain-containing protein [Longimicrobiaceae bacterium]
MRAFAWMLALLLTAPAALAGQAVQGRLLASPGGEPVPGALVSLLDARGSAVDTAQSDAGGRFDLAARRAGEYRVRAERVGYATAVSPLFPLEAGETLELRLDAAPSASMLEGLEVTAPDRECVVDPRGGGRTAAVWDEARKSLELAEYARGRETFNFTLRTFQRELEPGSMVVRNQTSSTGTARTATPYVSLPAEDLAARGYVRADGEGTVFYSPDARVLLSDVFLDSHCFRLEPGRASHTGLVGLAFEPVRGQRLPDVRGVLWLDPASAELRSLDFSYTGLRGDIAGRGDWGGRLEFERLPDGSVIVRRWSLRMPLVGRVASAGGSLHTGPRTEVVAVREEGAEVVSVALASGRMARASTEAAVRGEVFDSTRSRPLAGAAVFLAGTPYAATADGAGRFTLAGVPEGRYALAFTHPRLDSLAYTPEPVPVTVGATGEVSAALAIPRGAAARVADVPAPVAADTGVVRLEGITVTAEREARILTATGFYDRQRTGTGTFLNAAEIARRDKARVSDLVQGIRGIYGRPAGIGGRVYTTRRFGEPCYVPVYLDGILVQGGALERLTPGQIAAVEVYEGSETPARFIACHSCDAVCGAIVVWTKGAAS